MKNYEVGNFTFKIVGDNNKKNWYLKTYFKHKEVDSVYMGSKFNKNNLEVAASDSEVMLKAYKTYESYSGDMPPVAGYYVDETAYIIKKYDVATGKKTYSHEFRKDHNELEKGEKVFKEFKQPSLEL